MGAGLVAMAARITAANPKHADRHDAACDLAKLADAQREKLMGARVRDEAAFENVMKTRGDERQVALREAAQAPLDAMRLALDVQRLTIAALRLNNAHLESDLGCASEFAAAAVAACAYNVSVNHSFIRDETLVAAQRSEVAQYELESRQLLETMRARVRGTV